VNTPGDVVLLFVMAVTIGVGVSMFYAAGKQQHAEACEQLGAARQMETQMVLTGNRVLCFGRPHGSPDWKLYEVYPR